jgi:hypothetical protein
MPNSAYRVREYLTEKEVDRLIEAADHWRIISVTAIYNRLPDILRWHLIGLRNSGRTNGL